MITFAQISDIHLAPLPPVPPMALIGKRLTGYLSWRLKRAHMHRPEILSLLLEDLGRQNPDHLCVTGDLVNIALPAEIDNATAWLKHLAGIDQISLIPGNHDAYTHDGLRRALAQWQPWMTDKSAPEFPYVRRRGAIAFIGLSTAVVTPPFFASGRLGTVQLARLEALLQVLGEKDAIRVIMLHHPPQAHVAPPRKALADAADFRAVLARAGAELVLHGHMHKPLEAWLDGPAGAIPVFGAGSASLYNPAQPENSAHYYIFSLEGRRLRVRSRRYRADASSFEENLSELNLPGHS